MNLADAIRKAAMEGSASPTPSVTPPAQPLVSEEVESLAPAPIPPAPAQVSSTPTASVGSVTPVGADPIDPVSPNTAGGNVVRLELFLSAEQMSNLFRAIMAGQHTVLTLREAAAYLRVPAAALEKLAHDGEVPGLLIDGRWRFPKSNLDEWLAWRALPSEEQEHVA